MPFPPRRAKRLDRRTQVCADGADRDEEERVAAAWLYAWSREALRPVGERLTERIIGAG